MTKYIKDKNGKFSGSLPDEPKLETSKVVSDVPPLPVTAAPAVTPKNKNGIEWVVSMTLHDGTQIRGVQVAWYGHAAIDFFAKKHNVKFKGASSEKKTHFDNFLAQGLRKPLEDNQAAATSTPAAEESKTEASSNKATVANCDYKGCDGEATETVNWSTPVNRAGKVSPSGQNAEVMKVCKGHWWALTTAMYGSD
jgi:hypothetical protein